MRICAVHTVLLLTKINQDQLHETKLLEIVTRILHHDCQPCERDTIRPADWQLVVVEILSQKLHMKMRRSLAHRGTEQKQVDNELTL
jgi:hypothetical protein